MNRYLYVNQRGFRNEFTIYAVPLDKVEEAERWAHAVTNQRYTNDNYADVRWITRKEADRLTARERQNAKDNLAAGLNLHQNPVGATEFTPWETEDLGTMREDEMEYLKRSVRERQGGPDGR
jgi:acetyl-CoA acetyltransferase